MLGVFLVFAHYASEYKDEFSRGQPALRAAREGRKLFTNKKKELTTPITKLTAFSLRNPNPCEAAHESVTLSRERTTHPLPQVVVSSRHQPVEGQEWQSFSVLPRIHILILSLVISKRGY